jgi:hypothetical protein
MCFRDFVPVNPSEVEKYNASVKSIRDLLDEQRFQCDLMEHQLGQDSKEIYKKLDITVTIWSGGKFVVERRLRRPISGSGWENLTAALAKIAGHADPALQSQQAEIVGKSASVHLEVREGRTRIERSDRRMPMNFGEILLSENLITPEQLQQAIEHQKANGGRLWTSIVKLGFLNDDVVLAVLARQYNVPPINLAHFECDSGVVNLIPMETAIKYQVLPLSRVGSSLTLAMVDPTNSFAMDDIRFMTGFNIEPVVASEATIMEAIKKHYGRVQVEAEEKRQARERAEAKPRVVVRGEEIAIPKPGKHDNGGWLRWFAVGCIFVTGDSLYEIALSKTLLAGILWVEVAVVSGWLAFSLATKRRELFTLLKVFFAIHFLFGLCVVLFAISAGNSTDNQQLVQAGRDFANGIFRMVVVTVWWFYFARSKRVRATYGRNLQLFDVPSRTSRVNQRKDGRIRINILGIAPLSEAWQRPSRAKNLLLGFAIPCFVAVALNAATSIISAKAHIWAAQGLGLSLILRGLIVLAIAWRIFSVPATLVMILASLLIAVHLRQRQ